MTRGVATCCQLKMEAIITISKTLSTYYMEHHSGVQRVHGICSLPTHRVPTSPVLGISGSCRAMQAASLRGNRIVEPRLDSLCFWQMRLLRACALKIPLG